MARARADVRAGRARFAGASPVAVSQAELIGTGVDIHRGVLLMPREQTDDDPELTFAPAAARRAVPGRQLGISAPTKDPALALTKLGLQNIDKLLRREVTQEPPTPVVGMVFSPDWAPWGWPQPILPMIA